MQSNIDGRKGPSFDFFYLEKEIPFCFGGNLISVKKLKKSVVKFYFDGNVIFSFFTLSSLHLCVDFTD